MSGRDGGGSSSSSSRDERSGTSEKKKANQQGVKADLLEIARGAVSAFLKGSPPQARESGLIFDLHSTRYKDSKEAKNRGVSYAKANPSVRSGRSSSSTESSTRASSSTGRTHSSSSSSSHSNRSRHSAIQRPWQVHGDAPPDMEVEYNSDAELPDPAGTAEAALCAEKVRVLLKKARQGAWTNLKKELDVQCMIWQSLALARRGAAGANKKEEASMTPEDRLIADFEQALKASATDAEKAVSLLQDIMERDAQGNGLLSNSVLAKSEGCIKAESIAGSHRTLEQWLLEAGTRGCLYKNASADGAEEDPVGEKEEHNEEEESKKIYSVQELSELLLACELTDNAMVYCICRVLSWLAGAPESGASLTLAMGTTEPGDGADPYTYLPPSPSVSPPGSHDGSETGVRRLDLTSLQHKSHHKKKPEGSHPKDEASPTKAVRAGSPPPSLPPASLLPQFPRYGLSDPLSLIPLKNYPTGLAKDLHADERSTTAGSGAAEAKSVGSDGEATCGSWDGEHRARIFIAL